MRVVLDTNVFIAAGFNPHSHSARILQAVRTGDLALVWHEATRAETGKMLRQIPRLSWDDVEALFRRENEIGDSLALEDYAFVADMDDRKFAALSELAGCPIVTSDSDLLSVRDRLRVPVLTPGQFFDRYEAEF